jgi:hypothetical protein
MGARSPSALPLSVSTDERQASSSEWPVILTLRWAAEEPARRWSGASARKR